MIRLKAGLTGLKPFEVVDRVNYYQGKLADAAPEFDNIVPTSASVLADNAELLKFQNQMDLGLKVKEFRDLFERAVRRKVDLQAAWLNAHIQGDPILAEKTGFPYVNTPTERSTPGGISTIKVKFINDSGDYRVYWSRSTARTFYELQRSRNNSEHAEWTTMARVEETGWTSTGNTSGELWYYRVRGVNKKGNGPYSNSVRVRVP